MPGLPGRAPKEDTHHQRLGEAQSEEIKRRTRVVRIFPNREACLRLVTALVVEQSEEWVSGRRYLNMEELMAEGEASGVKREEEMVALMRR